MLLINAACLDHALLFDQLLLPGVDSRGNLEVAGAALGQVELLDALIVVADQREVFGARLMQADDVSAKARTSATWYQMSGSRRRCSASLSSSRSACWVSPRSINRSICIWRTG